MGCGSSKTADASSSAKPAFAGHTSSTILSQTPFLHHPLLLFSSHTKDILLMALHQHAHGATVMSLCNVVMYSYFVCVPELIGFVEDGI